MEKAFVVIGIIALLLLIPIHSTYALFENQYTVSPVLRAGMYAYYAVIGDANFNYINVTILKIVTPSILLLRIDGVLINGQVLTFYQLFTVKAGDDDIFSQTLIVPSTTGSVSYTLVAKTAISIPVYGFFVPFIFITPNLQQGDFINLDERSQLNYNQIGYFINGYASSFIQLNFRKLLYSQISGSFGSGILQSWIWDRQTGVLISYINNEVGTPKGLQLIKTNMWGSELSNIQKAWNNSFINGIIILANDWFSSLMFVVAIFFSFWEAWLIVLIAGIIYYTKDWIIEYRENQRALKSYSNLSKLLEEVNEQGTRVKYIEV